MAILEETSEVEAVSEETLAETFGIDRTAILDYLRDLEKSGLLEGHEGSWWQPSPAETTRYRDVPAESEDEWLIADDESLY